MSFEKRRDVYEVSTDPARLDAGAIHEFLSQTYWAEGIPKETVERSLRHSLCFGLYEERRQIGLARVVTDLTTYAYLCDVYVLPEKRGLGLGRWLIECVLEHPGLQDLRRFGLVTRDAHELYRPFGFTEIGSPDSHMEIVRPGLYKR